MLLGFILLFFLNNDTVKSQTSNPSSITNRQATTKTEKISPSLATTRMLPPLQLVAHPDYPVAAGQRVILQCKAFLIPENITWFWQRLHNHTWEQVGVGVELTLTEPEQSGQYRCRAERKSLQLSMSQSHTVYIISTRATVGENLGVAAFVLSLLALMIIIVGIILWMGWQGFHHTIKTPKTADKGFSGPEKPSNKVVPQINSEQDVYMNYTSNNQAYTDLDPANMTGDHVYSSLS